MSSDQFDRIVLKKRKQIGLEVASDICQKEGLSIPKVNFDGCQEETESQLAHYHPDLNKICISVRQLNMLKTREAIRDTMFHELAHMVSPDHGGTFSKAKERFVHEGWRPPSGVIYHGPEYYRRKAEETRKRGELQKAQAEGNKNNVKITAKKNVTKKVAKSKKKKSLSKKKTKDSYEMTKTDIEESRKKLAITEDENRDLERRVEKEREELNLKAYENMDTSFGDEHGENRWNRKVDSEDLNKPNNETLNKKNMSKYYQNWEDIGRKPKSDRATYRNRYSDNVNYTPNQKKYTPNKTHAIFLIKALVITIIILILSAPNIDIISSLNSKLNATSLQSLGVLLNFLIIFFATLIYDHVTSKGRFFLQEVFSSLFASLLLILGSPFQLVVFVLLFLLLLSGYMLGKRLEEFAEYHGKRVFVNGTVTFLIFIWIFYILVSALNTNNTNPNFSNGLLKFVNSLVNSSKLSQQGYVNGTSAQTGSTVSQSQPSSQSVLNSCLSKVNSLLQTAEAKLPSGTSVSIVNSTVFYYNLTAKTTINNLNSWIVTWNSGYGYGSSESCQTYYPNLYVCGDFDTLSNEINVTKNLTSLSVVGAGVAIKFQFPPQAQSNGYTEVSPFLCDPTGTLMTNSYNYLKNKNSYS